MNISQQITQPEGRRLEFKETLPERSDLAKTVVAFANDAGGVLFVGIKDNPRTVVGIDEINLFKFEEQISNIIFDRCYPAIIPEISSFTIQDKQIICVTVYRGSMPPYYLKEKGKMQGSYIRVGSTNRLADESIIHELERRKQNISFDGETRMDFPAIDLNIDNFKTAYFEKTGELLDIQSLQKLELIHKLQNTLYPTNGLVLFSDSEFRSKYFHYAKIECARFKGTQSGEFIDQKA